MPSISCLTAAFLVSCAGHQSSIDSGEVREKPLGAYDYRATIGRYEMRGVMFVLPDTVIVKPESEYCQPVIGAPDQMTIRYECKGTQDAETVVLRIDRHDPLLASKWVATFVERKQRRVCSRYALNAQGQQVCVEYRNETYDARTTQSGPLRIRRTTGSD